MATENTLFQQGPFRSYRLDDVTDIDHNYMITDPGDGLNVTEISGNRNSYRQSDGDGTLVARRVVRGDGTNTVYADSSTITGTENILGILVRTDGTNVRVATNGSIVDGYIGLTKHAKYYLGTNGQIQTTPGVIPVEVGIAVSTTELLIQLCCCYNLGFLELQYCFSSVMFDCEEGAHYCLVGTGTGECIPALRFDPAVDQYWYCGFQVPPGMNTAQNAELRYRFIGGGPSPSLSVSWRHHFRIVPVTSGLFTGGSTYSGSVSALPLGHNVLQVATATIPGGTLVHQRQVRLAVSRQGTVDSYADPVYLVGISLAYVGCP